MARTQMSRTLRHTPSEGHELSPLNVTNSNMKDSQTHQWTHRRPSHGFCQTHGWVNTYIHEYPYIHLYANTYTYVFVYTCIDRHTCMDVYMYWHTYTCETYQRTLMNGWMFTYTYTHIYIYMHTNTNLYVCKNKMTHGHMRAIPVDWSKPVSPRILPVQSGCVTSLIHMSDMTPL